MSSSSLYITRYTKGKILRTFELEARLPPNKTTMPVSGSSSPTEQNDDASFNMIRRQHKKDFALYLLAYIISVSLYLGLSMGIFCLCPLKPVKMAILRALQLKIILHYQIDASNASDLNHSKILIRE